MSPSLSPDGALRSDGVRSVADVNRDIRKLWEGGVLADKERYHQLLVEWAAAVRAEQAAKAEAELAA